MSTSTLRALSSAKQFMRNAGAALGVAAAAGLPGHEDMLSRALADVAKAMSSVERVESWIKNETNTKEAQR